MNYNTAWHLGTSFSFLVLLLSSEGRSIRKSGAEVPGSS